MGFKQENGFQARYIRQILGVRPSYWSRITNAEVLRRINATPLSNLLLEQQLLYFGKLYRLEANDPRRELIFQKSKVELKISSTIRRRGRPRSHWATEVQSHMHLICGVNSDNQIAFLNDAEIWKSKVRAYCRS